MNIHLRPGPELDNAEREVAAHQRFADLVEVTAVSEAIRAARPLTAGAVPLPPGGQRGGSRRGSRRSLPPR